MMLEKTLFYSPQEFENGQKKEVLKAVESLQNFPQELNELRGRFIELLLPEIDKNFI